jgi:DNA-binding response OmpR family regulator
MPSVRALVVSADRATREQMALATRSIGRRLGEPVEFLEAADGEQGVRVAWRERPDLIVADEIASRAGAFALAKDLRGAAEPFRGPIVILLDRHHDAWLAKWSGADLWFVKPVDPFELADRLVELIQAGREGPDSSRDAEQRKKESA